MTAKIAPVAAKTGRPISARRRRLGVAAIVLAPAIICSPHSALADEGGVSFWIPGLFGSLAATPQQPGWSMAEIYYHTSVSAGADVARSREFTLGRIPANVTVNSNLNLNLNATGDLGFVLPSYVFATPVLGGQASVSLLAAYGVVGTSLAGTLSGVATGPLGNNVPFVLSDSINDTTWGFGDLAPMFQLKWNAGVNNYMTYLTGDIPVGAYQSTRLSNIGIGHGAIDAGGGYTYFNPATGHEFSGVLGFTYNFVNNSTQYKNGVDLHFDWGASQFLTKEVMVGLVGYVYKESAATAAQATVSAASNHRCLASVPRSGSFFRSATCRAISTSRLTESSARQIVPAAGIPGSPSLSRRLRPERLRRQSRSSENISVDQAAACRCLGERSCTYAKTATGAHCLPLMPQRNT